MTPPPDQTLPVSPYESPLGGRSGGGVITKTLSQRNILVAEDNPVHRIVVLYELEKLGCRSKMAKNGLEAVNAARGDSYDLILMDCRMPEMDGYLATAKIRRQEDGRHHIPIIALTAYDPEESRDKC